MRRPLLLSLAFAIACSSTGSSSLATGNMKAYLTASIDDDAKTTLFQAILSQDLTTDVVLDSGDTLTVTTDKDTNLPFTLGDLHVYHSPTIQATDRATATISLHRAAGVSAPSSIAAIPPAFAFTSPVPQVSVAYAGGTGTLSLAWSNPVAGATVWAAANPCNGARVSTGGAPTVADTGTYAIPTKDLTVGAPTSPQCIKINVWRLVHAKADPAFKANSTFDTTRVISIQITLTP